MKQDAREHLAGEQNHYVVHVAEINKSNDVVSTQDIYNENGLLVVPKNTRISHRVAERILQHKLIKPFEEQIQLQNALTGDELRQDSMALLTRYPDLQQVHSANDFQDPLDQIITTLRLQPVLTQKLTVMRECLPQEYEKALFCAWLSALIATEAALKKDQVRAAYLAGLVHDVGLLHISPDILHKQQALTPEEWRAMQSHVVVSFMILKNFKEVGTATATAVLEHHERCDGSGYPVGKTDDDLSLLGQVIGMADSLQAIRINQFAECGRNLRDALPFLHMNAHTHFLIVYHAMCSILQKSGLQPSRVNPLANVKSLVTHLYEQGNKLQNAVALLEQVTALASDEGNSFGKLMKVLKPVVTMIESSGVVKVELVRWLETLRDNDDSAVLDELLAMELMQSELCWQLKNVCKTINECSDSKHFVAAPETRGQLADISGRINKYLCA